MKHLLLALFTLLTGTNICADEVVYCRYLQVNYDTAKLEEELQLVADYYMPRHRRDDNWLAIPLRNATGTSTRAGIELHRTLQQGRMFPCKNSEYLEKMPYISSILDDIAQRFETTVGLVRLSKVPSLKAIMPHSDGATFDLDKGKVYRLHIPICTGENVIFEIAGNSYRLAAGALYYTNVSKRHAVYNNGLIDRIHLIIDVEASPMLRAAIFSCAEIAPD